jgi:hypothetical protein
VSEELSTAGGGGGRAITMIVRDTSLRGGRNPVQIHYQLRVLSLVQLRLPN